MPINRAVRSSGKAAGSMLAILLLVAFVAVVVLLKEKPTEPSGQGTAETLLTITGTVADELGQPLVTGKVAVDGAAIASIEQGGFKASVAAATAYQLRFEAPGFYPIIHTFSHHELVQAEGHIPAITLVSRKPGRTMFAFGGDVMAGRRYYKPLTGDQPLIRPQ
ncbi:MAG: carboxypeptidase-like regulatory domain-containing protein, partial [Porticoccaceae bacterium]|nr:carboxypeptidase-like regulatory domain-containing protein [Porticoccaceae bacterium]